MRDIRASLEEEQWVIWNGSLGILDTVAIGRIEIGPDGRLAWLEEPYDMVGPFSLSDLETRGRIGFAACLVMSRRRWREDQVELRREAHKRRRTEREQLFESYTRTRQGKTFHSTHFYRFNEKPYRELLNLPVSGKLEASQIKSSYRRLAQKAHPDAGGDHEQFVQITEARDVLLRHLESE